MGSSAVPGEILSSDRGLWNLCVSREHGLTKSPYHWILQITEQISNSNGDLEKEIEDLTAQKEELEEMLKSHDCKKERKADDRREEDKENSQDVEDSQR